MALDNLTKITGPGISTDTNWVGNNANYTGIVTASSMDVDDFVDVGSNIKLGNAGVITATSFVGDGSALTGVANTDFVVGTAITMGTANFTGNVTIGGTLTYEDVTNIDSVGIITAQKDIHVGAGLSVVGVTTIRGNLNFPHANQGDANDGRIGSGTFGEGLNIVGTQTVSGNGRKIRTFGSIIPGQGGADLGTSALDTCLLYTSPSPRDS